MTSAAVFSFSRRSLLVRVSCRDGLFVDLHELAEFGVSPRGAAAMVAVCAGAGISGDIAV